MSKESLSVTDQDEMYALSDVYDALVEILLPFVPVGDISNGMQFIEHFGTLIEEAIFSYTDYGVINKLSIKSKTYRL